MVNESDSFSVREAAQIMEVSERSVQRMVKRKLLLLVSEGTPFQISAESLRAVLEVKPLNRREAS